MTLDTDVLILGGGCAGLSLAVALAQHAPRLRVTTLEQRTGYSRDRTWCFWNTTDHPFRAGITHEWHSWRVQAGGTEARQHSRTLCYQHLPADNFYAMARETVAGADQRLILGAQAGTIQADGTSVVTSTDRGAVRSRWVFDARTVQPGDTQPALLQRFLGWHVRCAQPCFDPMCVDLMDFQPCTEPGRTVFFYVLPFTPHEALVEITYLDQPDLQPEPAEQRLRRRMEQVCPQGDYEIVFRESGALPMGTVRCDPNGPAIPIGTRGGRVKPSSGYAFQRIQRQSRLLAQAMAAGRPLPRQVEPAYYRWLDSVFLAALQRHPERVQQYFLQLFQRVRPEALIPFLSETASLRDIAATMLALPKLDFIEAALLPGSGL